MSPRSLIITETHMNRSNRLLSSSLSLCVWAHVSTICETRPYVSLSLLPLLFFPFPCPIFTFACSSQVLLSLSLCLSLECSLLFLNQLLCVFFISILFVKSSCLCEQYDLASVLCWVTGQKVLWASLWISLPVRFQAQGHWGSPGVDGIRAPSRFHGSWQLYCG